MNPFSFESKSLPASLLAIGICAVAILASSRVEAACSPAVPIPPPVDGWQLSPPGALMPMVYRPGEAQFIRVMDDDRYREAGIVGTWRFTFVSDGNAYPAPIPYGATVDFGTQQWHGDGTEFMISGGRAPSTGDVCMGEWQKTGNRTYKLKHIALAYASSDTAPPVGPVVPAAFVGPAIIRETVTLSHDGNRFEGRFTLDQYAKDEIRVLEHISGTVTATRFTVD
jgi:hypothetical protein